VCGPVQAASVVDQVIKEIRRSILAGALRPGQEFSLRGIADGLELFRPAATEWDIRTLETLWHASERYVRLAFSGLDASPDEHSPTRTRPPPDDRRLPKPRSRSRFRIRPPPPRRQRATAQRAIV
jgi:hypothetical protein